MGAIRHPYILSFTDSADVEDSALVVTEYAIPLHAWLKQRASTSVEAEKGSLEIEVLWGIRCILEGLAFLHSNCKVAHCFFGPHACFVTRNGGKIYKTVCYVYQMYLRLENWYVRLLL
jgi:hypothetical protein